MQQNHTAFLQRQVAISVGATSIVLSAISFLRRVLFFSDSLLEAFLHPAVSLVVAIGLVLVITTTRASVFGRAIQTILPLVIGCASALTAVTGDLTSSVFLGLGLMLASEYGFLVGRGKWFFGIPLSLYVVAFGFGIYRDTRAILATVHTIMGAALIAYIFLAIVRTRLKDQKEREEVLESKVAARTEGLRKEVQRRAELEQTLRDSAEESQRLAADRALLLHELHHRTKNDLQLIASMIRLHGEDGEDTDPQYMFRAAEDRIMAIALVHEYLYASRELAAIQLDEYLDGLITHLRAASTGSGVAIHDEIRASVVVGIEPAIHIGLAINELVQNSRKHAFPDGKGGQVKVRVEASGDTLLVSVTDNGVGMTADAPADGYRRSIGIEIVESLVAQLGGVLSLQTDKATRWNMELSLSQMRPKTARKRSMTSRGSDRPAGVENEHVFEKRLTR